MLIFAPFFAIIDEVFADQAHVLGNVLVDNASSESVLVNSDAILGQPASELFDLPALFVVELLLPDLDDVILVFLLFLLLGVELLSHNLPHERLGEFLALLGLEELLALGLALDVI